MSISRRDFLKFSALLTASTTMRPALELFPTQLSTNPDAKNVLIIVFDALSGSHVNFLGYPRETMPNLSRLLERATVYHSHYSSANSTTPGTASLLTGRQVWEHLVFKLTNLPPQYFSSRNIFSFFDDYYKIGFSHNYFADNLLTRFQAAIDRHEFFKSQYLQYQKTSSAPWFDNLLRNDYDTASLFKSRLGDAELDGYVYALMFPSLLANKPYQPPANLLEEFPRGLPGIKNTEDLYILETAIDWCSQQVAELPQPFLGYFHFYPPHDPYNTRKDFVDTFLDDGFRPPDKPRDPYALKPINDPLETQWNTRQEYDEFILYVDSEFGRLFSMLEQQGILDNTLLVFTTDHGELIERGLRHHGLPYLFDPLIHVPLVIFEPGQTARRDIYSPTSAIDLLPTLLHYTGHDVPSDLPGQILPPFNGAAENPERKVYALFAKNNPGLSHITTATLMMRTGNWKVIRYSGYQQLEGFSDRARRLNDSRVYPDPYYLVFNLENDPEELNNLAENPTPEIQALIDDLEAYFHDHVEFPNTSA